MIIKRNLVRKKGQEVKWSLDQDKSINWSRNLGEVSGEKWSVAGCADIN